MNWITKNIVRQLANSKLLTSEMNDSIVAGNPPSLDEIVTWLIIGTLDAEAVTSGDPTATWIERRVARQVLAVAFLNAIAISLSAE